jgi:hypothetical protein
VEERRHVGGTWGWVVGDGVGVGRKEGMRRRGRAERVDPVECCVNSARGTGDEETWTFEMVYTVGVFSVCFGN